MKFTNLKKYQYKSAVQVLLIAVVLALFSFGCKREDFILPDRNSMDERLWQEEGGIQLFLNGTYSMIMPDFPFETQNFTSGNIPWYFWASDENILAATGDAILKKVFGLGQILLANDLRLIGVKQQGSQKWDNRYFDIARCNLGLTQVPNSPVSAAVKRSFMGQFYALRAMAYFDLVRTYGGVPLLLEVANPENVSELGGRQKASVCVKQMVDDLDSAMVNLDGIPFNDGVDRGKWTRYAAAAFKAKVLLYWASPQFNPANDASRWQTALQANKEAYDLCVAAGRSLNIAYADIFLKEGVSANNPETIIVRSYSEKWEKRFNNVESKSRPQVQQQEGPVMMVMYQLSRC